MTRPLIDATPHAVQAPDPRRGHSTLARTLVGSRILDIAAEIRALQAKGVKLCNLTVGDFAPGEFPIPERLREGIRDALSAGQTNYPPSDGMPALREAIQAFYAERLGLSYPLASILVASGARPLLFGAYGVLVDPGDTVVYPVPSWNNDAYGTMFGANAVAVPTRAESRFMPTAAELAPHLGSAKLVVINSPLNPAGTVIRAEDLRAICESILAENAARAAAGRAPCYLVYDQIYWMLSFDGAEAVTPVEVAPEMAAYTIFVDGISKAFAATGLRVGWCVGPTDVVAQMKTYLGHVGAWAPKPEQVATAGLLREGEAVDRYHAGMKGEIEARLHILHQGLNALRAEGFDVEAIPPQGAIYLSARFGLFGATLPGGEPIRTNRDIRKYLLDAAAMAIVPFQAFGLEEENGWFRLSVGAVSRADCEALIPRLRAALTALGARRATA